MNTLNRFLLCVFVVCTVTVCTAQTNNLSFSVKEAARIENFLASDALRGREAGTPEIDKAADFIAEEMRKAGLQPLAGSSFLQSFSMLRAQLKELKFKTGSGEASTKNVFVVTSKEELEVTEKSGYEVAFIKAEDRFLAKAAQLIQAKKNMLVVVDTSFARNFSRLGAFKRQQFRSPYSVVFLLGTSVPPSFSLKAEHRFEESKFANVVGVLPGKSKAAQQVIFSAHYDHIGVGKAVAGDSIYNGANDDAAGTTAVIMLAQHFKKTKNNERTLVFAAFTAEEKGGFGSQYFSQSLNPEQVAAMFNIEMIGTESKWGKNSAFITGFDKTDMGALLQKALQGSAFKFYPDPYPQQQLFYRSDNATLARLGVPAHTISTAKMEAEPNYHQPSDEVKTLDLENMVRIIEAIAQSSKHIVSGKETPTRVKTDQLQ